MPDSHGQFTFRAMRRLLSLALCTCQPAVALQLRHTCGSLLTRRLQIVRLPHGVVRQPAILTMASDDSTPDDDDLMASFRERLADATFEEASPPAPAKEPAPAPAPAPVPEPEPEPDYFSNPFVTAPPESKKKNAVDTENEKRALFLKQQQERSVRRARGEFEEQEM